MKKKTSIIKKIKKKKKLPTSHYHDFDYCDDSLSTFDHRSLLVIRSLDLYRYLNIANNSIFLTILNLQN